MSFNHKSFWNGLGSFWNNFEDRQTIEHFWEGLLATFTESSKFIYQNYLSSFLEQSPDYWEHKYLTFPITWSGLEDNRINNSYYFPIPDEYQGMIAIPTLSGLETGQVLEEITDYKIVDGNKIHFLNNIYPDPDLRYGINSKKQGVNLYAEIAYRLNPLITHLYSVLTDSDLIVTDSIVHWPFTYDGEPAIPNIEDELSFRLEKAKLINYISWGLYYLKQQRPSIQNLKRIYNILYNLPFSYQAGTVSINGDNCTVGDYTYYLPGGESWSVVSGQELQRFELLTSGIEIKDRITDSALIGTTFKELENTYSFILNVNLSNRSSINTTMLNNFNEKYVDKIWNYVVNLI